VPVWTTLLDVPYPSLSQSVKFDLYCEGCNLQAAQLDMLRRVALRALIAIITTQTSRTLPLVARVVVRKYSNWWSQKLLQMPSLALPNPTESNQTYL
jgi:hypothetical protein